MSELSLEDLSLIKNGSAQQCYDRMQKLVIEKGQAVGFEFYTTAIKRHGKSFLALVETAARQSLTGHGVPVEMIDLMLETEGGYTQVKESIKFLRGTSDPTADATRLAHFGNSDISEALKLLDNGVADELEGMLAFGAPGSEIENRLHNTAINIQQRVVLILLSVLEMHQRGKGTSPELTLLNLMRNFVIILRSSEGFTIGPVEMLGIVERACVSLREQMDNIYAMSESEFIVRKKD